MNNKFLTDKKSNCINYILTANYNSYLNTFLNKIFHINNLTKTLNFFYLLFKA